jgi:hypothetical protein
MMKRLIFSACILFLFIEGYSQTTKTDVLQKLEGDQTADQSTVMTATIKSATRLFRDKDDLTSVIFVIPADSTVNVLGSDDTFMNVSFNGIEGYIYARHAEVNRPVAVTKPAPRPVQQEINDERNAGGERPVQQRQRVSRYDYLMGKYGTSIATKLYAGKIWKGMTAQMVKDSWGSPKKINRIINGNNIREEWIFQNTWLYLQNDELVEWGPTK